VEEADEGHSVVLFADSSDTRATPEDSSSGAGAGIRFHGARAGEVHDSIQELRARRSLRIGMSNVLSYDYEAKKAVVASARQRSSQRGGAVVYSQQGVWRQWL
jgi:uncharacterized protein involved in type VI secretion and phage assembly